MRYPEKDLIGILKKSGVDFTSSLPCEKIKSLLYMVQDDFPHVPLTREEEGVGISAGAALAGKRPAMFVQSSGIGNMINALLSLTGFYELPLSIFISLRGHYKEKIAAQFPMGQRLPEILKGAGIRHSLINTGNDFDIIEKRLAEAHKKNIVYAFLLSPEIWEGSGCKMQDASCMIQDKRHISRVARHASAPRYTRYEILEIIAPYIESKAVVCNLGIPSKELYHIKDQPSNFYMLGSMGMATPIGLGISLASGKDVIVIDGDGSLLMNPGTLATAAYLLPKNLTVLAIDNGSYGSTGDQPTLTGSCVDLEIVARGFGIKDTCKVSTRKDIVDAMKRPGKGVRFIHAIAIPGNKDVPNIPIGHLEIKEKVQDFIRS